MKKLLITAALASTCIVAGAQDMMSKRGTPILPEAGDWSIGADATSLINYFGNLFTKDANTSSALSSVEPFTITGLYVVDENTAYRAKIRIGYRSQKWENIVRDDVEFVNDVYATTIDEKKTSSTNFNLGVGLQKMRGKGRLKGIYGAEVGFGIGSSKDTYTYGNDITSTNLTPTTTDDWSTIPNGGAPLLGGRPAESKGGSEFSVNLNAFIGAEYFFAPKLSLSAEYGWGLEFISTGEGETSTEQWNVADAETETIASTTGKKTDMRLDVAPIGSITLHFYF